MMTVWAGLALCASLGLLSAPQPALARHIARRVEDVPADWVQPFFATERDNEVEPTPLLQLNQYQRSFVETDEEVGAGEGEDDKPRAPEGTPGPWMYGYGSMAYNHHLSPKGERLGPYRALTNHYSDGTPYPLNMQKYDYFPSNAAGDGDEEEED